LTDTNAIIQRLSALFTETFHFAVPSADTDLFESGMLDSLQLVELLLQLERQFGFRVKIEDIELDDLRTLARLARLVARAPEAGGQTAPRSSRIEEGKVSQERDEPGLRPRSAESRTGRAENGRV
jgi:D-alanine--poly(phosphoribitol) ligase subunit 2